jgi:hypothetical protein
MIIRIKRVKRLRISVRQIVITVFLMQGHLRSDYKSRRSMILHSGKTHLLYRITHLNILQGKSKIGGERVREKGARVRD